MENHVEMEYRVGDIVRFGRHDDRIGVIVDIERIEDGVVLVVKTPQNVLYGQAHDYCTPDMNPRPATVSELADVTTGMRDIVAHRMNEYLESLRSGGAARRARDYPAVNRITRVAALAANAVAMLALAIAAADMPVVQAISGLAGGASAVAAVLAAVTE